MNLLWNHLKSYLAKTLHRNRPAHRKTKDNPMFFLSHTERCRLHELLREKWEQCGPTLMDDRPIESDEHLVFEALQVLAHGHADQLYSMLHPEGHESQQDADGGRTMQSMRRMEESHA